MQPTTHLKRFAMALCLGAFSISAQAQQDTLAKAVKEAMDYQPEIQAKLHAFNAATFDRREAFGGYLPSVDALGSVGEANRQHDGRGDGQGGTKNRGWYSRNYAEISLTQILFDGFRVRNQVAKAEHTSRMRYYELLDEAENKSLEVTAAYLDVLRYREMVRLAQQNVDNHKRVQAQIEQRAERGVSNNADLLQINGRLALAESNLLTEIANLQTVSARFQRLVGRLPAEDMAEVAAGQFAAPEDIQAVLDEGYANNPSLHAAFENIDVSEAALKEAKSHRYPTFEFGASHGAYKNNNGFDRRDINGSSRGQRYGDESIVEIRVKYNLYRGGSDRAAERAAFQRINQAEDLRDKACVDLRQTASIAHSDIGNLKIKQDALKSHRDGSVRVVSAYREQFDIGRRSLLDVLDSENEAFQAERAYAHGHYDLIAANARTLQSMGQLLNTLSVSAEKIPTLSEINADSRVEDARQYCANYGTANWDVNRYFNSDAPVQVMDLNSDTLFDTGSAVIKAASVPSLERFVEMVKNNGTLRQIEIVGHTDSTGSMALNRKLSLDRAIAVRDFMVARGVNSAIISAQGVASTQPIASNSTAEGRAENRRVTLTVKRD